MTKPHEVAENEGVREEHRRAEREREEARRGITRLETFCDGVFAIAATLLILNLDPPSSTLAAPELTAAIVDQLPQVFAFALSFWVIARFWVVHHSMFAYFRRYDSTFVFLNLLLLFLVVFLPFPTEIVGENAQTVSEVLYAATIALTSVVSAAIWSYGTYRRRLVEADLDALFIRGVQIRAISGAVVFVSSIPVAFVNIWATFFIWVAFFPLARVALGRWERRRRRERPGGKAARAG